MKNYHEKILRKTGNNSSKRLLIVAVIDVSPSTATPGDFRTQKNGKLVSVTANKLINQHLQLFINQLLANKKTRSSAEICFVTYSTEVHVSNFIPITRLENNVPVFNVVRGGTRTISAIDAAYKAIDKRTAEITSRSMDGPGLYTSCLFLLTDGDSDMHDSDEYTRQVTQMVNARTIAHDRTEKVLPFIVGLGSHLSDNTKKMLADLSKGFVDGCFFHIPGNNDDADTDYSELFHFISESIVRSIPYAERDDFSEGFDCSASMDELLADLRERVGEVYKNMLCTVYA